MIYDINGNQIVNQTGNASLPGNAKQGQILMQGDASENVWAKIDGMNDIHIKNLVPNGNFANTNNWTRNGHNVITVNNNTATLTDDGTPATKPSFASSALTGITAGKKLLMSIEVASSTADITQAYFNLFRSGSASSAMNGVSKVGGFTADTWYRASAVVTVPNALTTEETVTAKIGCQFNSAIAGQKLYVRNAMVIDITDFDSAALQTVEEMMDYIDENCNGYVDNSYVILKERSVGVNDIVVLGDSVMANYSVPDRMAKLLKMSVKNCAIGGTRMGKHRYSDYDAVSFYALADAIYSGDYTAAIAAATNLGGTQAGKMQTLSQIDWSKVKHLIVAFGTNDWHSTNTSTGNTVESVDYALEYGLGKIMGKYPHLNVIVCTPIFRPAYGESATGYSDSYVHDENNETLVDFVDAIKEKAKDLHVICCDNYFQLEINAYNQATYIDSGGTHPTEDGCKLIAERIAATIKSLFDVST